MFITDPYIKEPNTRKLVRYFLNKKDSERDLYSSLYGFRFIQDIHLNVMPIGGRSENIDFAVNIDPPSKKVEDLIRVGLCTHHGESWNLTKVVCKFIDEAIHTLACYGKTYYEIIYFYTDESKNNIKSFMIERIPNNNIRDTFGFYWQYVPKNIIEPEVEILKRLIWLPKKDLLVLSIPKAIGGVKKYKKLLTELQWLSKCTIPKFVTEDMSIQQEIKGYDFSTYRENQEIFLAKITRHLGWTARGTFSERSFEFYQIYRYLKFERTKAILREYVLDNLNKSLKIIGNKMGFKARIKLEGIPSHEDYDSYTKQLIDGSLQFSDVVKLMRI